MTRAEFENQVDTWEHLVELCQEYGLNVCDDIVDDNCVAECIYQKARDITSDNWGEFAEWVDGIPRSEQYLYYDGENFLSLDSINFDEYMDRLREEMLAAELFDVEEEEVEDDLLSADDTDFEPDISFPINELVFMCCADIAVMQRQGARSIVPGDPFLPF